MSSTVVLSILALLVVVGIIFLLRLGLRTKVTTLEISRAFESPFRSTEAGKALAEFVSASFTAGESGANRSAAAREQLRRDAGAAMIEIDHSFRAMPTEAYTFRWAMVYTATKLEHPAATNFLAYVASLPIPPERSSNLCHGSTVGSETAIRTRAIHGLGALALAEHADTRPALFALLKSNELSLRVGATQALLQLPDGEQLTPRISELLDRDAGLILNIRRLRPEEMAERLALPEPRRGRGTAMAKPDQVANEEELARMRARRPRKGAPLGRQG